ncbi:MAG: 1-acyl-sn-glycerol-3-phosphate acyltransferase [Clostridia bacterium]|nr:1-acyl-sn-glycerol-3-phosphate acyltransferase [Clostridia bacterium]
MKNKKKKWMKFRHRVVRAVLYYIIAPWATLKYNIKVEKFKEQGDRAYLILMNHQTAFDQFFVGMAFKGPVYYVASEDLFSKGFVSSVIRWLVEPIPIRKQTTDVSAVMNCIRVAKEGGTIAIAPEGNRTYSGKTIYMNPAIAPLARKLKLPIALYRIEGGYGAQPRWSDKVRRGKMRSYVSRVIEPQEYEKLTNEELYELIQKELYVDEAKADALFKSGKKAEYLERAMYVCPFCGLSTFESHGNEIECKKCNRKLTYGEDKTLNGIGFEFPFKFVADWYAYQENFVNDLDVTKFTDSPIYTDYAALRQVFVFKSQTLLRKKAKISLYGNRVVIDENTADELNLCFDDIGAITVLGKNKANIYYRDELYQLKGDKRFNALKYVNIFFRYKNIVRGESDDKFLGL